MINLDGYSVIENIYTSDITSVYRGLRDFDKRKVIFKTLTHDYPTLSSINRLKHEFSVTNSFNNNKIIKPVALEKKRNSYVVIYEDIGGVSLSEYSDRDPLNLEIFLKIAVLVTQGLAHIHDKNIVHKDINPSNIVFSEIDDKINIIDFGMSSSFSKENQKISYSNRFEGTIDYISPEQTGRMNRGIDYRSDFYSLGVTFYKLLTSRLPFNAVDTVGKIHAHIAKEPISPTEINSSIPQAVSDIVLKLMNKNAEDRYQSSYGLVSDLKNCLKQWKNNRSIVPFNVGRDDVRDQFRIPQKLYGREKEISVISSGFERISSGKTEVTLIGGYSGVGKTSLVNEIHKSIVKKKGYFVSGKSDKLKRDIPLGSLIQAFRKFIQQILTEEHDIIDNIKYELVLALKQNIRLMIDVIPELEIIVGKFPAVEDLPVADAKNRFISVFRNFINIFATNQRPLVIFIDDLQWVDSATLNFISKHLLDSDSRNIYMLGAYRDNETDQTHPVTMMFKELEKSRLRINRIKLRTLNQKQVKLIIDDTLKTKDNDSAELSELVFKKTDGNPFFVNEFLKNLNYKELIKYDYNTGSWRWDLNEINKEEITDNVVDLMVSKIKRLPDKIQDIIKIASCIGSRFSLYLLSKTTGKSKIETSELLLSGINEGLVYPENNDEYLEYLKHGFVKEEDDFDITYRFFHDRIHQAANILIEDNLKKQIHLKIGEQLYNNSNFEEDEVFTIVNHLNISRFIIDDEKRKTDIARFNLIACRKAKKSAAYDQALNYARIGISILNEDYWNHEYSLIFDLFMELFECEYLNSNFDEAERVFEILISKARTNDERADVYMHKMNICGSLAENKEVIRLGILGLKEMGIRMKRRISNLKILYQTFIVKLLFLKENKINILKKKEIDDPYLEKKMFFFQKMVISAYFFNKKLMVYLILLIIKSSLTKGNSKFSAYAYTTYASLIQVFFGKFKEGYELSRIALKLEEKYSDATLKIRIYGTFGGFISHWNRHLDENYSYLQTAFNLALECGDFVFAGYITSWIMYGRVLKGDTLDVIKIQSEEYSDFLKRIKDANDMNMHLNIQYVNILWDQNLNHTDFVDDKYNVNDYLETKNKIIISYYYLLKLKVCYILGNFDEGFEYVIKSERLRDVTYGLYQIVEHNFFNSLYHLKMYEKADSKKRKEYLRKVKKNQKQMKIWSDNCKENNLHKYLLIEAEIARIKGKNKKAELLYEKAIYSASEFNFLANEAIANERAAGFYLDQKRENLAKLHINEAYFAYQKWGAFRKTRILLAEHPGFLGNVNDEITVEKSITRTEDEMMAAIDMLTVMKATQTLSEEIIFDRLIQKLMAIVIENAGAHRGFLILKENGKYVITAHIDDGNNIVNGMRFENCDKISAAVINYVIRTRENLVLDDASVDATFIYDNYIRDKKPKSLLCIPILYNSRFSGVLYLENNRVRGAFTYNRVEVLKILASQAAISIDNASIYSKMQDLNRNLEKKVFERTKELSLKNQELEKIVEEVKKAKVFAENASRDKSEFMAHISKEVLMPMNTIIEMAENSLHNSDPEKTINNLRNIKISGRYLMELLKEILEYSDIEAGKIKIEKRVFSINDIVDDLFEDFENKAKNKEIELYRKIDDSIPEALVGDPIKVIKILRILISNSLKFTDAGYVRLNIHLLRNEENSVKLKFEVTDTGIGIKKDSLEKVFKPFVQEDISVTKKYGGTGLGLSIAKKLTELMDGSISAESLLSGTKISFTLLFDISENFIDDEEMDSSYTAEVLMELVDKYRNEENYVNNLLKEDSLEQFKNILFEIKRFSEDIPVNNLYSKIEEFEEFLVKGDMPEKKFGEFEKFLRDIVEAIEELKKDNSIQIETSAI